MLRGNTTKGGTGLPVWFIKANGLGLLFIRSRASCIVGMNPGTLVVPSFSNYRRPVDGLKRQRRKILKNYTGEQESCF